MLQHRFFLLHVFVVNDKQGEIGHPPFFLLSLSTPAFTHLILVLPIMMCSSMEQESTIKASSGCVARKSQKYSSQSFTLICKPAKASVPGTQLARPNCWKSANWRKGSKARKGNGHFIGYYVPVSYCEWKQKGKSFLYFANIHSFTAGNII